MPRRFLVAAAFAAALCSSHPLCALQNELIPEATIARHGLARPWFAQVELDQGRTRLRQVLMYEGVLYAQTNTAIIHAIDAETGKTQWSKQIGRADHPSMACDAKGDMLAVVNGSRLYVVNRFTGSLLYERSIKDAPGAGPAMSSKRAYVPSVTGLIGAYQMEAEKTTKKVSKAESELTLPAKPQSEAERRRNIRVDQKPPAPVFCQSFGHALVQPLVTRDDLGGEYVVWPTDKGYLNLGRVNRDEGSTLGIKYRLTTGSPIVSRPAYLPPDPKVLGDAGVVFAASCDGFVYAIQEESGDTLWRFSTGEPIVDSPIVIGERVYVTTQLGGMYSLDIKTGKSVWWAENVARFAAASKTRVYAADSTGRLLVLSAASGARLDTIPTEGATSILANGDTDRIYLISDGGLIQCFRETEQVEPIVHNKERKEAAKAGLTPPPEPKKEAAEEKPAKKEHAAPKAPAAPREHVAPKDRPKRELKPKQPRTPRKSSKKAGGKNGDDADGGDQFGDPAPPKAKTPKSPRNKKVRNNNPF
jgi:outer membrane protein assembly factor BamB